ncbi:MAG: beta-ketoacyl-ACP synthase III [Myxococcota bacterium]
MVRTRIAGVGGYVPERRLTNAELAARVETTDEWIVERTGVRERRIAAPQEATSDMAIRAARAALKDAGLTAEELDLIVVCTCTPDMAMPSTAAIVQGALGATRAAAFDVNAVCAGFVYGLHVVRGMVESGLHQKVLLIGADKMSSVVDEKDRNVSVLFGDGAGALVCVAGPADGPGVLSSMIRADGTRWDLITVPAGGSREPLRENNVGEGRQYMKMQGREVYRLAVRALEMIVREACDAARVTTEDVDLIIPHQANARIVRAMAERTGIPLERVVCNIEMIGNTGAGSIPLAWLDATRAGRLKPGHTVVFAGMGSGMTWGSAVLRY